MTFGHSRGSLRSRAGFSAHLSVQPSGRRSTTLAARVPLALSDSFANDPMKRRQWQAFAKRGRLCLPTTSFGSVVEANRTFLMPAVTAVVEAREFNAQWPKETPGASGDEPASGALFKALGERQWCLVGGWLSA